SANLVSKVYFPRLALPLAAAGSPLVDLVIGSTLLAAVLIFYGEVPGTNVIWAPIAIGMVLATALGVGSWLAALNVRYRDVRHAVPFLIQIWLWISPVAYSTSLIPDEWRTVYAINPLSGAIDLFRWAMFGAGDGPGLHLVLSVAVAFALFASGLVFFRRAERSFADVI
ncbi:MAG: ABC transporter permease, partial [Gammaproteobacteria bacterium]